MSPALVRRQKIMIVFWLATIFELFLSTFNPPNPIAALLLRSLAPYLTQSLPIFTTAFSVTVFYHERTILL